MTPPFLINFIKNRYFFRKASLTAVTLLIAICDSVASKGIMQHQKITNPPQPPTKQSHPHPNHPRPSMWTKTHLDIPSSCLVFQVLRRPNLEVEHLNIASL